MLIIRNIEPNFVGDPQVRPIDNSIGELKFAGVHLVVK